MRNVECTILSDIYSEYFSDVAPTFLKAKGR